MIDAQWVAVDDYISNLLLPPDPILETVLKNNEDAGLPAYDVSPNQGKFLQLMAKIQGSKKILEIGTLGGYSTIWLARALPEDGQLITLEANAGHAAVARKNIELSGLAGIIILKEGEALDTLPQLEQEAYGPFDLIFIDADKPNNPNYLDWALKLSRKGSIIIADNVVRKGEVANDKSEDPNVLGIRLYFEKLASLPHLNSTALQTVGKKGYDGFALTIVE